MTCRANVTPDYPYCGKHPGEYLVDEFKEVAGKYHLQGDKSEQQAFMAERHDYVAEMERVSFISSATSQHAYVRAESSLPRL